MDDTRTRDARAGRPRRDLPESLAWLYDQDGDEQELSREPRPYVPGAAVPPGPVTSGGRPADPEALPTLLPFSAPEAELSEADEDPEPFPAVVPPDALLAPPARSGPLFEPPVAPDAWAEPQPLEPAALRRLFDTPRFAEALRAIPAEDWPAVAPFEQEFRTENPADGGEPASLAEPEPAVEETAPPPPWRSLHTATEDTAQWMASADQPFVSFERPVDAAPGVSLFEPVGRPLPAETDGQHDEQHDEQHAAEDTVAEHHADEVVVQEHAVQEDHADEVVVQEHAVQEDHADELVVQEHAAEQPAVPADHMDAGPGQVGGREPDVAQQPEVQAAGSDDVEVHEPPAVPPRPDLGDPALGPVWTAVHEALQSTARHALPAVDVRGLDQAGRRALAGLLGVPTVRAATRVDLVELEAVVTAAGMDLASAAERFVPLGTGRRARTQTRTAAVRAGQEWLAAHPAMAALPWTATWLETIRRDVAGGDASLTAHEVVTALSVLESLTGAGTRDETGWRVRTEIAAQVADDEHALDEGSAVAALVLRGLAAAAGTALPADPAGRRRLWARHGVLPDLVSASCSAVGVAPADDASGRRWRLAALDGAPVHVTARDLRATTAWVPVDEAWPGVLVVDNPRVLDAIAEQFGGRVPAVWVEGTGDVVGLELVARLFESGTPVRFVADFDGPGLALGSLLARRFGATSWRMTPEVYGDAVRSDLPFLAVRVTDPDWAPGLGTAMAQAGRAVPVEQVLDELLAALALDVSGATAPA